MSYALVKNIHLICVGLTFISFSLRYIWMLCESNLLQSRITKIAPHIIDTVLLVSAITLALQIQQYPLSSPWITAKIGALVLYIIAGTVALKRGKTKSIRTIAGIIAYLAFIYMVLVAYSKNALIFI